MEETDKKTDINKKQYTYTIRLAVKSEAPILAEFMRIQAKETEDKDIDKETVLQGATNLFDKPKYAQYYVAVYHEDNQTEEKIAGMMMIHHEMSPSVGGLIHWINSVYVHPDHRRRGIFRQLYNHVFAIAKADPIVKCIRLYVDTTNGRAMGVYNKMGMYNIEDNYDFNEADFHFD